MGYRTLSGGAAMASMYGGLVTDGDLVVGVLLGLDLLFRSVAWIEVDFR